MSSKKLNSSKLQIQNKYNRQFSEAFKRSKVQEMVEKRLTIGQLCDLYKVSRTTAYKWLYKYSAAHKKGSKTVVQMESEAVKTKRLLEQIAELERIIGQKQLEIDYLSKTLEVASEEVGYDLKKKYARRSSSGSENTARS